MTKVFIDGSAGTTGLRIHERLQSRSDLELLLPDEAHRKDEQTRRALINEADIVFLCLPDAAAVEAAAMAQNEHTVIIDTSTAHRTNDAWTYGFPELRGQRDAIRTSRRIANPGCHASGFIALVAPLVQNGILRPDAALSCFSLTGYSGGGKKMIAEYEDPARAEALRAPRMYGLSQTHKHLPEMQKICGLQNPPVFCPVVSSYYAGMEVTVPLSGRDVAATPSELAALYRSYYTGSIVRYVEDADEDGLLSAAAMQGRDDMRIYVFGNEDRILLVSRFDNLGKGASGAAIQNMNIVLGTDEKTGLCLPTEE